MGTGEQEAAVDALRDLLFDGAAFRAAVAEHFGVGVRETEALGHLNSRGVMTAGELARVLHLTPGTVTSLLDRLEAGGLAVREPDHGDHRKVTVSSTARGRDLTVEVRSWLALCLELVADRPAAVQTFTVVGHGLRSIRNELRQSRGGETPRSDPQVSVGRGDAEALAATLARAGLVLRLSHALAQERHEAQIAATVSTQLRAYLGAMFVGIALLDEGRETLRYLSLDPLPDDIRRQFASFSVQGAYPVCAAALHGRAYFHESVAAAEAEFPGVGRAMAAAQVVSMVHLPLVAGADVIGALAVAWDRAHHVDIDDQGLLTVVAGYAAQALRRP